MFASVDKALDERTIGHNPERLNLLKGGIVYSNQVCGALMSLSCQHNSPTLSIPKGLYRSI